MQIRFTLYIDMQCLWKEGQSYTFYYFRSSQLFNASHVTVWFVAMLKNKQIWIPILQNCLYLKQVVMTDDKSHVDMVCLPTLPS